MCLSGAGGYGTIIRSPSTPQKHRAPAPSPESSCHAARPTGPSTCDGRRLRSRVQQCGEHGTAGELPSTATLRPSGSFLQGPACGGGSAPAPALLSPPCSEPGNLPQGTVIRACLCQSPQDLPRSHGSSRMLCIFLISIKVHRVLLGLESCPLRNIPGCRAADQGAGRWFGGRELLYLTVCLFDSGLRNANLPPPHHHHLTGRPLCQLLVAIRNRKGCGREAEGR